MTKELYESITKWQEETFPQSTSLSKIEHLKEEVDELITDINENNSGKASEFADCFMLLFGAAYSDGMSYENICNAIEKKMKINRTRKWGKVNEKGFVNHIR